MNVKTIKNFETGIATTGETYFGATYDNTIFGGFLEFEFPHITVNREGLRKKYGLTIIDHIECQVADAIMEYQVQQKKVIQCTL
jgi:hypothetical protein